MASGPYITRAEISGLKERWNLTNETLADPSFIDSAICKLVQEVNAHPCFITTLSCAGHVRKCTGTPFVSNQTRSYDDVDGERYAERDYAFKRVSKYDLREPVLCTNGQCSAYLQFMCTKRFLPFTKRLERIGKRYGYIARWSPTDVGPKKKQRPEFSYSYTGDEQVDNWTVPNFARFWDLFARAWKQLVDSKSTMTTPAEFPIHRNGEKCNQCCRDGYGTFVPDRPRNPLFDKLKPYDEFSEHTMKTELFAVRWTVQAQRIWENILAADEADMFIEMARKNGYDFPPDERQNTMKDMRAFVSILDEKFDVYQNKLRARLRAEPYYVEEDDDDDDDDEDDDGDDDDDDDGDDDDDVGDNENAGHHACQV